MATWISGLCIREFDLNLVPELVLKITGDNTCAATLQNGYFGVIKYL